MHVFVAGGGGGCYSTWNLPRGSNLPYHVLLYWNVGGDRLSTLCRGMKEALVVVSLFYFIHRVLQKNPSVGLLIFRGLSRQALDQTRTF